jgi:hypothetical protein
MRFISAVILALSLAGAVRADPRLDEKVYDPYIETGQTEVEIRTGTEVGGALGGAHTTVLELEQGLTDHLSLSLVSSFTRDPGEAVHINGLGLEAVVFLGQIPKLGVDTGVYLEYTKGFKGESDGLEGKLLLARTSGRFQGLVNLIVERPVGVPAGEGYAAYGYAASATWRTVGRLRLGVQAFGDLGDDHHFLGETGAYVGPMAAWSVKRRGWPASLSIDGAWLSAVGPSRGEGTGQFRLNLSLERRF